VTEFYELRLNTILGSSIASSSTSERSGLRSALLRYYPDFLIIAFRELSVCGVPGL
jgi:hypothetical protein